MSRSTVNFSPHMIKALFSTTIFFEKEQLLYINILWINNNILVGSEVVAFFRNAKYARNSCSSSRATTKYFSLQLIKEN